MVFNEEHKELFNGFKRFYLENTEKFCKLQDEIVKKGTEQTPMNYWLQTNNVDVNLDLPLPFKLTHLQRKELFSYNWQLNEDQTPFFLKYGYNFSFNGIPKEQRTNIMKQVWDSISSRYNPIIIIDDYGNPKTDIRKAIDEMVDKNVINLSELVGEKDGFLTAAGWTMNDREGGIFNI
jgi:hypothetical protein